MFEDKPVDIQERMKHFFVWDLFGWFDRYLPFGYFEILRISVCIIMFILYIYIDKYKVHMYNVYLIYTHIHIYIEMSI